MSVRLSRSSGWAPRWRKYFRKCLRKYFSSHLENLRHQEVHGVLGLGHPLPHDGQDLTDTETGGREMSTPDFSFVREGAPTYYLTHL